MSSNSTKTIHKNQHNQGYTTIGDPYSSNNDKLPSRWKEKQFVTQKLPKVGDPFFWNCMSNVQIVECLHLRQYLYPSQKNADNGLFFKLKYDSEPYIETSETYSKTQPLANRKLGFGSHDASKTGEFTCWKTTERYRSVVKQENKLLESHRDEKKEREILQKLPQGAPRPPKNRDGKTLDISPFMYDVGRSGSALSRSSSSVSYDPKSTRDCFYNLPKHAKGDIRRLGGHRPSSAVIGEMAWKHRYTRPEYGSSNGTKKFYDCGHLEVKGF